MRRTRRGEGTRLCRRRKSCARALPRVPCSSNATGMSTLRMSCNREHRILHNSVSATSTSLHPLPVVPDSILHDGLRACRLHDRHRVVRCALVFAWIEDLAQAQAPGSREFEQVRALVTMCRSFPALRAELGLSVGFGLDIVDVEEIDGVVGVDDVSESRVYQVSVVRVRERMCRKELLTSSCTVGFPPNIYNPPESWLQLRSDTHQPEQLK
ncbi:uncharacterized protein C8Q71DRAFT_158289 [Rhodofomes roseus]|uniref:Uncharacterized protein n=1 Tax=Rhodofomes roseus TaxID=34475 RepID=A0ABQ8K9L1_9APHY|nr:uncharacterized protein C8Q71DRAFT_158289 [Rhodofomes roseus]KAH9834061.1 hypothetical protein C8Q71DRAFT_158289 [Rhodofomes roseus]